MVETSCDAVKVAGILDYFLDDPDNLARRGEIDESPHLRDRFEEAAKYLRRFFAGKIERDGRQVADTEYITLDHLNTVVYTAMPPGINMFYAILDARGELVSNRAIRYFTAAIGECRLLHIPQYVVAGILCVHAQIIGKWGPEKRSVFVEPIEMDDEPDEEQDAWWGDFDWTGGRNLDVA